MDFRLTDEQELLRRTVRAFAETEIRPHVREWDEAQHFPIELVPALGELGLMGIQFPEEYGGAGMSAIDYCLCIEELARVDPAVSLSVAAHNGLCSAHIAMFGTEDQKQRWLVPLARGAKIGAWGLTESTSGSDAAGMRTSATRTSTGWVLNGAKTFITHGSVGHVMVVMAVTDKAAGPKGISAFIVEHGTPGMRAGRKEDKLGMRASDTTEGTRQIRMFTITSTACNMPDGGGACPNAQSKFTYTERQVSAVLAKCLNPSGTAPRCSCGS